MTDVDDTEALEEAEEMALDPRYELYAEWLEENYGLADLDPAQLQVAVRYYGRFQASPENKEYQKEASKARQKALEEHRERVDAKKAEKARLKAEKQAAKKQAAETDDDEAEESPAPRARKAPAKKAARGKLTPVPDGESEARPARGRRTRGKATAEAAY